VKGIKLSRNFGQHYAITAGLFAARGEWVVVMDCDLQHDETILPAMLRAFEEDSGLELAVGSRYTGKGGGTGDWSKSRVFVSRFATRIGSIVRKTELTDPMSGFFAIRRNIFEETVRQMTGKGFKILLDIVLSAGRPLRVREFPYEFRTRQHGESKLDIVVAFEYLYLLADKIFARFVPVRFVL
jgi:dolichol-phosphate mannosyltransferase